MDLKHLEIFVMVCRKGSMTRAASELFMTQPSVSRSIAELEGHYQKTFFDRIGKKLLLTNEGQAFLEDAERVLHAYEQLNENARKDTVPPVLHIGCSMGIGYCYMDDYVEKFKQQCPDTRVMVTENMTGILRQYILSGELDFAIVEGFITDDNLISIPFFEDEILLLCAPDHPLNDGHSITAKELAETDLYLPDKVTATRQLFDNVMSAHGVTIRPVWTGINLVTLIKMAERGQGITLLSRHWVEDKLKEGTLVKLSADFEMKRHYSFLYHRSKYLSAQALRFMEICKSATI